MKIKYLLIYTSVWLYLNSSVNGWAIGTKIWNTIKGCNNCKPKTIKNQLTFQKLVFEAIILPYHLIV